jgi:hypothetical protein
LLAIRDNQRWCSTRAAQVVDADAKGKVDEARWRKKDHPFLG